MSQVTKPTNGRRRTGSKSARKDRRAPGEEKKRADWRESARFWFWAILITLVFRAFIIEPYRIPTPSMEKTLLVGDFLFVSKLHYGPRTPNTVGIPFTGIYLRGLELPQARIPGFGSVNRGDVAVFNYPPDTGPIERRTPYVKRLVAMPGDRMVLVDKVLYVNDERHPLSETQMQNWRAEPAEGQTLTPALIRGTGLQLLGQAPEPRPAYVVNASPAEALRLAALPNVGHVEPYVLPEGAYTQGVYPVGSTFNRDNYGPLVIPGSGDTVTLSEETWPTYRDAIIRYERRTAEVLPDGTFRIDGETVTTYTFEQDYYFALGDNRDNSEDSRYWGLVPHDHLVGKAVLVFFSVNFEDPILGFIPKLRLRGFQPIR